MAELALNNNHSLPNYDMYKIQKSSTTSNHIEIKYQKNNTYSYQNKPEVRSGASED